MCAFNQKRPLSDVLELEIKTTSIDIREELRMRFNFCN